jgi:hypothetical protein
MEKVCVCGDIDQLHQIHDTKALWEENLESFTRQSLTKASTMLTEYEKAGIKRKDAEKFTIYVRDLVIQTNTSTLGDEQTRTKQEIL